MTLEVGSTVYIHMYTYVRHDSFVCEDVVYLAPVPCKWFLRPTFSPLRLMPWSVASMPSHPSRQPLFQHAMISVEISSAFCVCDSSRRFENSAVDRYRSPNEGMTHTMRFPSMPGREPSSTAASTAAPDEMPHSTPSSLASRRAIVIASSEATCMTSSIILISQLPGMNPAPMPWILCGPGAPPDMTGDSLGSTAMVFIPLFWDFRNFDVPVMVPPVPTPPTK
mmetsp:Transcript_92169/g.134713  ORF Transcript_92169/g.134713 Transcript_92169/m.134713 type:complete len:223 (-) Transcript_92169:696-1364(-)